MRRFHKTANNDERFFSVPVIQLRLNCARDDEKLLPVIGILQVMDLKRIDKNVNTCNKPEAAKNIYIRSMSQRAPMS